MDTLDSLSSYFRNNHFSFLHRLKDFAKQLKESGIEEKVTFCRRAIRYLESQELAIHLLKSEESSLELNKDIYRLMMICGAAKTMNIFYNDYLDIPDVDSSIESIVEAYTNETLAFLDEAFNQVNMIYNRIK